MTSAVDRISPRRNGFLMPPFTTKSTSLPKIPLSCILQVAQEPHVLSVRADPEPYDYVINLQA